MERKDIVRIAVDGPSGAGKSTIAKKVAANLGIDYIDTGAMYRAIGYKLAKLGCDFDDRKRVKEILDETTIDFSGGNTLLDGEIVNDVIRTNEASMNASRCSQIREVREKLVSLQSAMGQRKSVIMDGRDIGNNVLKDAEYKFFLTASPEERAQRRYKELKAKGDDITFDTVLEDIKKRDYADTTRELNPLRKAEDAIEVDSTGMNIDQVVDSLMSYIKH